MYNACKKTANGAVRNNTQEVRLLEALTRNALYTYEFDVTAGIVETEIIGRDGRNFTKLLGLAVPCAFDDMLARAFGAALQCRYTSESSATSLSRKALLDAFVQGRTKLEVNVYYAAGNQYVRITYLLSQAPENGHVLPMCSARM